MSRRPDLEAVWADYLATLPAAAAGEVLSAALAAHPEWRNVQVVYPPRTTRRVRTWTYPDPGELYWRVGSTAEEREAHHQWERGRWTSGVQRSAPVVTGEWVVDRIASGERVRWCDAIHEGRVVGVVAQVGYATRWSWYRAYPVGWTPEPGPAGGFAGRPGYTSAAQAEQALIRAAAAEGGL